MILKHFLLVEIKKRTVLRLKYEKLTKITEQENENLNRAEENEQKILNLKRKRGEIKERITKKHCELIDVNTCYVEEKNQLEKKIHEAQ